MKLRHMLMGAAIAVALPGAALASTAYVSGTAGPWDPTLAGNFDYGVHDNTAATSVKVNAGDTITVTWLSGLTNAFNGGIPTVDASGYQGDIFGSGADCGGMPCTGVGSSGTFFPSALIDPTNSGPQIALNELIGDFVDGSGLVLDAFAIGDGPLSFVAPTGAVALQLGVNDDIFSDNNGELRVDVSGSSVAAVPEPATWAMMLMGLGGLGAALRASRRGRAAATA